MPSSNNEVQTENNFTKAIILTDEFLYKKGLCGIQNLGNTCFMNSIIQCLNNTIPLLKYFMENKFRNDLNLEKEDRILALEWNKVSRKLWEKNSVVSPIDFLKSVHFLARSKGYNEFTGFGQNDSQEFLQFMLETLHNSFAREVIMKISGEPKNQFDKLAIDALKNWMNYFNNDYSIIVDIFYGQFYTILHTIKDGKEEVSKIYEPFNTLSLEIPTNIETEINIYDCLNNFTSCEELDSDSEVKRYKKNNFWKLPKILIIFFKRFNNMGNKIDRLIDYPLDNLDMSKYVLGYNKNKYKYELYGVSNHMGGTNGGHYIAYIRNQDNNWYKFNDNTVTTLHNSKVVSPLAYCLFYRLKT